MLVYQRVMDVYFPEYGSIRFIIRFDPSPYADDNSPVVCCLKYHWDILSCGSHSLNQQHMIWFSVSTPRIT